MITQILLDFISSAVASMIGLVPPLPPEISATFNSVVDGIHYIIDIIEPAGVIIPVDALAAVISLWLIALPVWSGALVTKVILTLARSR